MDARIAVIALLPLLAVPQSGTAAPVTLEDPYHVVDWVLEHSPPINIRNGTIPDVVGDNFCGGFVAVPGIGKVTPPHIDHASIILRTQVGFNDKEFVTNDFGEFLGEVMPQPEVMIRYAGSMQASGDATGDLGYFFMYVAGDGQFTCQSVFEDEKD